MSQSFFEHPIINEICGHMDTWRRLPNPEQWQVNPQTARLSSWSL